MVLFPVLALFAGYLCGSIPFGLLLTRAAGLGDVRKFGSGNIGATNVLRTGSKGLAAATLLLDALKGTLPALLAARYGGEAGAIAGAGALLGHVFPVWLGFNAGKGAATYCRLLAALAWQDARLFVAVWLVLAALFRESSFVALVACTVVPLALYVRDLPQFALAFLLISLLVLYK